jgi:rod shape-determining protein MreB
MLSRLRKIYSNDVGIDLGTANTLVYLGGHGVVINEPSVVAVNQKTGRVVAVGTQAQLMLGRTPAHIKAIRPLVDGVISDFEVTEEMMLYLMNKVNEVVSKPINPRVVVCVPTGITNVEIRAVYDATKNAGAREVYIVEEPMAAAIGIRLPVQDAVGSMIVDMGGGTTDIAVISLAGIVRSKSLKVAGDKLNTDIISYLKDEFKLLIGERTAEMAKMTIGGVLESEPMDIVVRGRDLVTGLPREVVVTDADIREALLPSVMQIIDAVKEVLETTPPEILSDVMHKGVILSGGGALIRGLPELMRSHLKIPVTVADDPLTAVARGTGIILDDLNKYKEVLITNYDDISPRF